ncbi:hypothetical protein OG624_03060 [Streptomyces virginiae]
MMAIAGGVGVGDAGVQDGLLDEEREPAAAFVQDLRALDPGRRGGLDVVGRPVERAVSGDDGSRVRGGLEQAGQTWEQYNRKARVRSTRGTISC